jgi:hypothetical protein
MRLVRRLEQGDELATWNQVLHCCTKEMKKGKGVKRNVVLYKDKLEYMIKDKAF